MAYTERVNCRICGEDVARIDIFKHRKEKHGISYAGKSTGPRKHLTNPDIPALERLHGIQKEITEVIRDLEVERDQLQQKLLVLDNTIARYTKMQANNL